MSEVKIDLQSKALKRLDKKFVQDFNPYPHQHQTLQVFEEIMETEKSMALFNYTSTGGGKTLASFAPSLIHNVPAIGVYSTNELIADQKHALDDFIDSQTELHRIDGSTLSNLKEDFPQFKYNIELLAGMFGQWSDIVLTNPDILYQIMFGIYEARQNYSPEQVFRTIIKKYPVIVFDEFHLYDIKQVSNVAWMIGLLEKLSPEEPKMFVFSSATPSEYFLDRLKNIGIETREVPAKKESHKEFIDEKIIMEKVDLTLIPANLRRWQALEAIENNLNIVDEFFDSYPEARGVFILDSVGDACRLADKLSERYEIDAGEVHGFMSKLGRREGLAQKITVGTTTIEVGIDFKGPRHKNIMVFEAKSAGQFLQRLGRLGRGGREKEEINIPNKAVAVVPTYVYNYITEEIGNDIALARDELEELVNSVYYSKEDFRSYLNEYAPIEALYSRNWIIEQNADDTAKRELKVTKNLLLDLYSCGSLEQLKKRYKKLEEKNILQGLLGFRGGNVFKSEFSPEKQVDFTAAIFDSRSKNKKFPFTFYNILWVIRKTSFELLEKNEFKRRLEKVSVKYPDFVESYYNQLSKKDPEFYVKVNDFREDSRRFSFSLPINRKKEEIIQTDGLKLVIERGEQPICLKELNRKLSEKRIVAYIKEDNPFSLANRKNLPHLFQIYNLKFRGMDGRILNKKTASITFDINAFLLKSLEEEDDEKVLLI